MENEIIDNIGDDELLKRDFFERHFDSESNSWTIFTFALRTPNPSENYLSVGRMSQILDVVDNARIIYHSKKLLKLKGYVLLKKKQILELESKDISIAVRTIGYPENFHAGIFVYLAGNLLDRDIDTPEMLRLKSDLLRMSLPTFQSYPDMSGFCDENK